MLFPAIKVILDLFMLITILFSPSDHEEHEISSNFIAAQSSRESKEFEGVRPQKEPSARAKIDQKQYRVSESNGSETSSNASASVRWSEIEETPHLKSYSQTSISDFNSVDELEEGKHFTQF